jgi:hypothetical protein
MLAFPSHQHPKQRQLDAITLPFCNSAFPPVEEIGSRSNSGSPDYS